MAARWPLIDTAAETEVLACSVADTNGVYFVPALSGLGAPHWDMNARGAFMAGGVEREHMVRAVLEAIAYQVKEVVQAINKDSDAEIKLQSDGGACQNNFLMQFRYPWHSSGASCCLRCYCPEQLLSWLWVLGLLIVRSQDQPYIRNPSAREFCHMAESSKASTVNLAALHLQDAPHLFQQRRYF